MSCAPRITVGQGFRRVALPLVSYYAVTLVAPLANGAAHSDAFVNHALAVLVVPPVAIVLACAVHRIAHASCKQRLSGGFRALQLELRASRASSSGDGAPPKL